MKLKANIAQIYPGSMYKVQIKDLEDKDTNYGPNYIENVPASFYSQYLWTAKLRAKKSMKKMYKAYNFNPTVHEVSVENK